MATQSPYRSLPTAQRVALVTYAIKSSRDARTLYVQRLLARGGGFRAVTLMSWPPDKLAREVVRLGAEAAQDELDLLLLHYVELEPAIQSTFLSVAGVPHENGKMPEDLESPYTDADGVRRGAEAVKAEHGEDGMRYLRTLVRYNREAWPGIEEVVTALSVER